MTQPNPKRPRHVQVQSVHDLSPHLRRIVFHSPELADYPHTCAAAHLKVLLPKAPGEIPALPEITPRGPRWADPAQKPVTRTYTLRHLDNAACTLAIDFVRHGDNGPASAFAEHAQAGQVVGLSAPVGPNPLLKPARRYLMAADLSALPALCALADTLPPDCNGDIFLLLPEPADLPAFRLPEKLRLHVAYGAAEHYPTLAEGFAALPEPDAESYLWLAGEASLITTLRNHARRCWQVPAARCYAVPYWHRGEAEESYHEKRHAFVDEAE